MAGNFKMADLRRAKESLSPKTVGKETPSPYSYEHRITLDGDTLDKLGIDIPSVGDKFHALGHAEVTHVSQSQDPGSKSTRVELQFKKMGLKPKGSGLGNAQSGLRGAVDKGVTDAGDGE